MGANPWTREADAILVEEAKKGTTADKIAEKLGMSVWAVRGRASRLVIKLPVKNKRRGKPLNPKGEGHKPFTERCGELLRQAGVQIL